MGAAHLLATGNVEPPLVAASGDVWGFLANAGLGAAFFLDDSLSVSAHAGCIALVPQPVIAVADQQSSSLTLQALVSVELGASF